MKFSRDSVRTAGVGDLETTELDRRASDHVRHSGKVVQVDYSQTPPVYRAGFGDANDQDNYILTDWLPAGGGRAQGDVDTHFLEVGEQVSMLAESGELATAHLIPAGVYSQQSGQQPGTQKAGVWIKKTKNGQEHSFDRETGAYRLICKGQQQNSTSTGSGTASGSTSTSTSSGTGSGSQQIPGTWHVEAGSLVLDASNGVFTITAGNDKLTFQQGKFQLTIGGNTATFDGSSFDVEGADIKNNSHSVGSTHKHGQVQPGGGQSGAPV